MLSEARKKSSNESMFMTMVDAELIKGKRYLDRYLSYLGTVGSNAPFIGLFGTVLGIIRAFSDLAKTSNESQTVVMTGISEALVATAIGLLVAIPAVVMYNYFQKESKRVANHCLYLSRLMTTKWNM
jgi:biopolymer transport protein ExbB